jgi:hypothetical protein
MGAALAGSLAIAPPLQDFNEIVRPPVLFAFLKERLLPKDTWFGVQRAGGAAALSSGQALAKKTK